MAHTRKGWADGLNLLAEWWDIVCEYSANEGRDKLPRDVNDFRRRSSRLCKFIREVAKADPLPIWELGCLIERREGIVGTRQDGSDIHSVSDPHATPSDIVNAVYRAVPLKDDLFRRGTTTKKAGRPKSPTTLAAESLLADGADTDLITTRVDISAANARQIKSRTRRKS